MHSLNKEKASRGFPRCRHDHAMPHMPFDPNHYMHHLDGMDLDEAQKIELIGTLWRIAQCFVDDAFAPETKVSAPAAPDLKLGFENAGVIDLDRVPQAQTEAANDNGMASPKQGAA